MSVVSVLCRCCVGLCVGILPLILFLLKKLVVVVVVVTQLLILKHFTRSALACAYAHVRAYVRRELQLVSAVSEAKKST